MININACMHIMLPLYVCVCIVCVCIVSTQPLTPQCMCVHCLPTMCVHHRPTMYVCAPSSHDPQHRSKLKHVPLFPLFPRHRSKLQQAERLLKFGVQHLAPVHLVVATKPGTSEFTWNQSASPPQGYSTYITTHKICICRCTDRAACTCNLGWQAATSRCRSQQQVCAWCRVLAIVHGSCCVVDHYMYVDEKGHCQKYDSACLKEHPMKAHTLATYFSNNAELHFPRILLSRSFSKNPLSFNPLYLD